MEMNKMSLLYSVLQQDISLSCLRQKRFLYKPSPALAYVLCAIADVTIYVGLFGADAVERCIAGPCLSV